MTQERVLIDDSIFNLKVVLFNFVADFFLDWEQPLFFSKIRGKERKIGKHASVTCEQRCRELLVAQAA